MPRRRSGRDAAAAGGALHQEPVYRLQSQLRAQAPARWRVLHGPAVRLGPDWRIPDLVVVRADLPLDHGVYDPADVALVVEVVSPSSRRTDRVVKPAEYAAAGIGHYWRIETAPEVQLHAYALADGAYRAGSPAAPFPVQIDTAALQP